MTTTTSAPLLGALQAVEHALKECGVTPVRWPEAASLLRLEYQQDGDTVGAVAFGEGLYFIDDTLGEDVVALVRAHATLACATS